MIWIVDKKVTSHLLSTHDLLAEVPLRISFEYAVDSGAVVEGSLSIKVLYNGKSVKKCFPHLEEDAVNSAFQQTANDAVYEHLALNGISADSDAIESVVVAAH